MSIRSISINRSISSDIYWITRCDQIDFSDGVWCGSADSHPMAVFTTSSVRYMIREGLITSIYKRDMEELEIQEALGTLCTMESSLGPSLLVLIPTAKAYALHPDSNAYPRTNCRQI